MTVLVTIVLAIFALGAQRQRFAAASPTCSAADLATARADINADCPCTTTGGHGAYVQCAKDSLQDDPKECRGRAVKCAAKSTCGTARIRCCRTFATGKTKCSVRSSTAKCRLAKGGTATPGSGSCCDCAGPACGNGIVEPPEECDPPRSPTCPDPTSPTGAFLDCAADCTCPTVTTTTTTTTTMPVGTPCGQSVYPICDGSCPEGEPPCAPLNIPDFVGCTCPPVQCGTFPTCGEPCPPGRVCVGFSLPGFEICACTAPPP